MDKGTRGAGSETILGNINMFPESKNTIQEMQKKFGER